MLPNRNRLFAIATVIVIARVVWTLFRLDLSIAYSVETLLPTISSVKDSPHFSSTDPTEYFSAIQNGVRSTKDASFFRALQQDIDESDNVARCARYGGYFNATNPQNRRIFYGALLAGEPWELLDIVATEAYGIYSGLVFVEGNRTQNLSPRPLRQLHQGPLLANLFGVSIEQVNMRAFVDETEDFTREDRSEMDNLFREHRQREEILYGWKHLGMQPEDVGFIADADESLTRDFFRAVQICDGILALDYEAHHCHHDKTKLLSRTRIFESSPECITQDREGWHPDLILGHCIEGIADSNKHPPSPRTPGSFLRAPGFGSRCSDWDGEANITDGRYTTWNAADFRRVCGGRQSLLENAKDGNSSQLYEKYTAFHFHNFFAEFNSIRFKYKTYGHAVKDAETLPIPALSGDLRFMYSCAKDIPAIPKDDMFKRVPGGFANAKPFLPIYFYDDDYRQRRHGYVIEMIDADERDMAVLLAQKNTTQ